MKRTADAQAFPVMQEAAFTKEEENILKARLFTLLSKQARLRTQGDHSSLREEDAAELLDSLLFTLRCQLGRQGMPLRTLLTADLGGMLSQGQDALRIYVNTAQTLYQAAMKSTEAFGSRSLSDTLTGIGRFFRAYDLRLYAHRVPSSIDYQLCLPVEGNRRGVLYVVEYLERLLIENALVTRFPQDRVTALLERTSPEYRELLINLYEPVASNAVGLGLLGRDIMQLEMTYAEASGLHQQLSALPLAAARSRVAAAANAVCDSLKLASAKHTAYLRQAAEALLPRICVSPQSACGVFSACP